ncbi:MAG: hypothetical protein FWB72_00155 [Firmicutes bacterium]|nr:hypothetical protein [Bacillota bacterium]
MKTNKKQFANDLKQLMASYSITNSDLVTIIKTSLLTSDEAELLSILQDETFNEFLLAKAEKGIHDFELGKYVEYSFDSLNERYGIK